MKQAIAFFDFDGTITRKDTLFEIIRFHKGKAALYAGMTLLSPLLVLFKMKVISNQRMKEIVLRFYFNGTPVAVFQEECDAFCRERLPELLRPKAVNAIAWHLSEGHAVYIVTASAENWVRPWAETLGYPYWVPASPFMMAVLPGCCRAKTAMAMKRYAASANR